MFGTLFIKEIKAHMLTFRFGAALITTFALIVLSVWVLGDDFVLRHNLYLKLMESYSQEQSDIYVPSHFKPIMHKAPSALSIFAQGEERRLGNAVEFGRWSIPEKAVDHLTNNKLTSARVSYDLVTIFTLVISLFSLLLTYDTFSGERESGTLKLMCSQGLSRAFIFTAKFFAGFVVVALAFLVSFLSALLVLEFVHAIAFSAEQWLAICIMVFTGLIYVAVFTAIGLLCSAASARSSTSLIMALLFWLTVVLVIPSGGNNLAQYIAPLLPPEEIDKLKLDTDIELKQKLDDLEKNQGINLSGSWQVGYILDENVGLFDTFTVKNYRDNIAFFIFQEELKQDRAEQIANLVTRHHQRKNEQASVARAISSISPAQQLRSVYTHLSGTDYAQYNDFMESCRRYRRDILNDFRQRGYFSNNAHDFFMRLPREFFQSDAEIAARWDGYKARLRSGVPASAVCTWEGTYAPLPDDFLPPFSFAAGRPDFELALAPLAILSLMAVILFFAGFAVFIRYDVR